MYAHLKRTPSYISHPHEVASGQNAISPNVFAGPSTNNNAFKSTTQYASSVDVSSCSVSFNPYILVTMEFRKVLVLDDDRADIYDSFVLSEDFGFFGVRK